MYTSARAAAASSSSTPRAAAARTRALDARQAAAPARPRELVPPQRRRHPLPSASAPAGTCFLRRCGVDMDGGAGAARLASRGGARSHAHSGPLQPFTPEAAAPRRQRHARPRGHHAPSTTATVTRTASPVPWCTPSPRWVRWARSHATGTLEHLRDLRRECFAPRVAPSTSPSARGRHRRPTPTRWAAFIWNPLARGRHQHAGGGRRGVRARRKANGCNRISLTAAAPRILWSATSCSLGASSRHADSRSTHGLADASATCPRRGRRPVRPLGEPRALTAPVGERRASSSTERANRIADAKLLLEGEVLPFTGCAADTLSAAGRRMPAEDQLAAAAWRPLPRHERAPPPTDAERARQCCAARRCTRRRRRLAQPALARRWAELKGLRGRRRGGRARRRRERTGRRTSKGVFLRATSPAFRRAPAAEDDGDPIA